MRSTAGSSLGRLAILFGAVGIALAVTVPMALGRESAGKPVTNYLSYVGGKAGKANPKLKPVVIGWVNLQGGQVEIGPNATPAAEIAVKYVNDSLGGIG